MRDVRRGEGRREEGEGDRRWRKGKGGMRGRGEKREKSVGGRRK